MEQKTVLLVLCRRVLATLFIEHIKNTTQMEARGVYRFEEAKNMALIHNPTLALVEIPERHGDPALDALGVCDEIKKASPGCQIMLMCPEQNKKCIDACVEAKKRGEIADYVFYETSPEYLTSKLQSLLPI